MKTLNQTLKELKTIKLTKLEMMELINLLDVLVNKEDDIKINIPINLTPEVLQDILNKLRK
jgi:hypothetical protein